MLSDPSFLSIFQGTLFRSQFTTLLENRNVLWEQTLSNVLRVENRKLLLKTENKPGLKL